MSSGKGGSRYEGCTKYCLLLVCVERDQPHTSRLGNAGSRDHQIDDFPIVNPP